MNKQFITEQKEKMLARDYYMCRYPGCYNRAVEPAHCIGQGKYAIIAVQIRAKISKQAAEKLVWHLNNIYSVCDNKAHNDYFNIHISQTVKFKEKLRELL